jgi:hypothetical protein
LIVGLDAALNTAAGRLDVGTGSIQERKASAAMTTMESTILAEQEQECVNELAEEVESIWRRSRPRMMRRLDRTECVKNRTQEAARMCRETTTDLQEQGIPFDQANSIALYEWVYLPDLDNLDEAT